MCKYDGGGAKRTIDSGRAAIYQASNYETRPDTRRASSPRAKDREKYRPVFLGVRQQKPGISGEREAAGREEPDHHVTLVFKYQLEAPVYLSSPPAPLFADDDRREPL